jgi:glycosyltransferase involved in cell wall biosynthesis
MKLDITVIILTYNEELHIRRCLENVCPIAKKVYVIDSPSTDNTVAICGEFPEVEVVVHKYPGNQAEQFNWALDNVRVDTEWVLRLDADEYLLPELVDELKKKLPAMEEGVSALSLSLARGFMGKVLRHGIVDNIKIVRIFRTGKARYEKRIMDEHLSILDGKTLEMEHQFIDDSRIPIGQFIRKHENYASREAILLLDAEYNLTPTASIPQEHGKEVEKKRAQKAKYAKMPLFWRAFAYFVYRYIIKLGFLDGKEGFLWDFLQGWWYRTLVDAKIFECKKACGNDPDAMRAYIAKYWGISL